jgi:hypothetical protein
MLIMRCVLYPMNLVLIILGSLSLAVSASAAPRLIPNQQLASAQSSLGQPTIGQSGLLESSTSVNSVELTHTETEKSTYDKLKEILGITYFTYFYGPGFHPATFNYNPNQLSLPENDGMYFQNQVSIRYKFSKNIALDFQTRFKVILNNSTNNPNFSNVRWETPRIGISGELISGNDWKLTGAINTDFPYFFPAPFTGYQSQQRKMIFTPGMFASLKYEPKNSKWSIFSVVSPRYLIYTDPDAAESQYYYSGYQPRNKPEVIIAFQPTANYKLSSVTNATIGTSIDYRKHVLSSWNIFNASIVTNGDSPAWRLNAIPLNVGITYKVSNSISLFPFVTCFPIAAQRVNAKTGQQSTLLETTSFAMWMYGTLF